MRRLSATHHRREARSREERRQRQRRLCRLPSVDHCLQVRHEIPGRCRAEGVRYTLPLALHRLRLRCCATVPLPRRARRFQSCGHLCSQCNTLSVLQNAPSGLRGCRFRSPLRLQALTLVLLALLLLMLAAQPADVFGVAILGA